MDLESDEFPSSLTIQDRYNHPIEGDYIISCKKNLCQGENLYP